MASNGKRRLLRFHELPSVLRFNQYILSGYRAGYDYRTAVLSLFQLHNETGNIWSHLLPAVFFFCAIWMPSDCQGWMHKLHEISVVTCLLASVAYHTCLACHHHYCYWIKIDVCGVYGLLLGSQMHVFSFAFQCHPGYLWIAIGLYVILGAIGLGYSLQGTTPIARSVPMLPLLAIRVGVLYLRLWMGSGSLEAWRLYALAEGLCVIGAVMNGLRIPERFLKSVNQKSDVGLLDYWLNSHQIMHVLVATAILCMRYGLNADCEFSNTHFLFCHS